MIPRARYFRTVARADLRRNHWQAVLVTLVFGALIAGPIYLFCGVVLYLSFNFSFLSEPVQLSHLLYALAAINLINLINLLCRIFLAGPLTFGYARYCLQMHDGAVRRPFAVLFSGFRYFGRMIGLYWMILLKVFLWALIAYVPAVLGILLFFFFVYSGAGGMILFYTLLMTGFAEIVCLIPAIRASYSYSMAFYLMAENPQLSVNQSIHISIELMRGNKWRLFCLHCSFLGWALLNLLTFGILGILYLSPYQAFANAAFYRSLVPAHPLTRLWDGASGAPAPAAPITAPPAMPPADPTPPAETAPPPESAAAAEDRTASDFNPDTDGGETPPEPSVKLPN